MTTTHSHPSAVPSPPEPVVCASCYLSPCVCDYLAKLAPGGELHGRYEAALALFPTPMPHRGGCPCPRCYSNCTATWRCPVCSQDDRGRRPCNNHGRTS